MAQLAPFARREALRFTFIASHEVKAVDYFTPSLDAELGEFFADGPFRYVPPHASTTADVVILSAHGSDLSGAVWTLRQSLRPDAVIALWFWDNHLAQLDNLRSALAADFVFPSHAYIAHYLFNPLSVVAGSAPACSAQWTRAEARALIDRHAGRERIHKAIVNYVDYEFSWRSRLLRELAAHCRSAEVMLMPAANRSRYFGMPRAERFAEWLRYKATVILPVDKDLSTRLFDALLAGQVPVVPRLVRDFDRVIAPDVQAELGIVRVEALERAAIENAIAEALGRFDAMGESGIVRRQQFVLQGHMLPHRVREMLETLALIAREELIVPETRAPGFGLYLVPRRPHTSSS